MAEEVLSRFEEVGLINDSAFADAWVESRHHGRGLARRALAQELRTKGVDPVLIGEAVAQLDSEQEEETARELVARKLRSTRGLDRDKRLRRLAGMLARKGYSEGLALRVVRQALEEEGENAEFLEDGGSERRAPGPRLPFRRAATVHKHRCTDDCVRLSPASTSLRGGTHPRGLRRARRPRRAQSTRPAPPARMLDTSACTARPPGRLLPARSAGTPDPPAPTCVSRPDGFVEETPPGARTLLTRFWPPRCLARPHPLRRRR